MYTPERTRTSNPQIRSLVLYPLSYGRIIRLVVKISEKVLALSNHKATRVGD